MSLADLVEPPLEYVCLQEGIALARDGDKLVGLCPFHDDEEPSFAMWKYDRREWVGCWACGFGPTDAIDLIKKTHDCDYKTALVIKRRYARQVLEEEWAPTALLASSRRPYMRDFTREAVQALEQSGQAARDFLEWRGLGEDAEWLMREFKFGGDDKYVVVPHYTPSGKHVTAIKYRTLGTGLLTLHDGSLAFLYGLWRDDGHEHVLITEGESDCWRMAAFFRYLDSRVLVLSVPSGAKPPKPHWLESVKGRNVAVLFDGDDTGRREARAWAVAGVRDLTPGMPEGQDASNVTDLTLVDILHGSVV